MKRPVMILTAMGVAVAWSTFASQLPGEQTSVPETTDVAMTMPDPLNTGSIPRGSAIAPVSGDLKAGLDALSSKNPMQALAIRNSMGQGTLDRHILTWAIATSGQPGVPPAKLPRLRASSPAGRVLPACAAIPNARFTLKIRRPIRCSLPSAIRSAETPEGAVVLSRALVSRGASAQAAKLIRKIWRNEGLDKTFEDKILAEFSSLLSPADHKARMDYLLYRGRTAQAKRFGDLGRAQSLYKAWAAINNRSANAGALLASMDPQWRKDPAYLFMRIENLRRQDKYDDAANLLTQMPRDRSALVNASQWWDEQRIVSRGLVDQVSSRPLYRVVDANVAENPQDVGEANSMPAGMRCAGCRTVRRPRPISVRFCRYRTVRSRYRGPGTGSAAPLKLAVPVRRQISTSRPPHIRVRSMASSPPRNLAGGR